MPRSELLKTTGGQVGAIKNDILTIEEVAEYLRVSVRTVYDWAQKGEIPCGRLGSSWRFRREDILEWVDVNIQPFSGKVKPPYAPKLGQIISPDHCHILHTKDKAGTLLHMIDLFHNNPAIRSIAKLSEGILRRENLMSTGLGLGVAVPHVRDTFINKIILSFAHIRPPLDDYDSLDDVPVEFIAMILAPKNHHEVHINLLSEISNRLKKEPVRENIRNASDNREIYAALIA